MDPASLSIAIAYLCLFVLIVRLAAKIEAETSIKRQAKLLAMLLLVLGINELLGGLELQLMRWSRWVVLLFVIFEVIGFALALRSATSLIAKAASSQSN